MHGELYEDFAFDSVAEYSRDVQDQQTLLMILMAKKRRAIPADTRRKTALNQRHDVVSTLIQRRFTSCACWDVSWYRDYMIRLDIGTRPSPFSLLLSVI